MDDRFPTLTVDEIDASRLTAFDGKTFVVADSEVNMACLLKLLPGAEKLFIMLHGAVDRVKTPLPVFARWNWGKTLGGHVLAVCDPTLNLDEGLRLGWFLGRVGMNPTRTLIATANRVRELLKIDASRMIFYGSSGGGFAALIAGSSMDVGRVVCINPQTDVSNYYPKAVARIALVFGEQLSVAECRAQHLTRWSAIEAIAVGQAAGRDLRIFYAQNLVDEVHYARHYKPFCDATRAPVEGGKSPDGRVLTHVYSSPEGHGAEPPELVKVIGAEGLAHILSDED